VAVKIVEDGILELGHARERAAADALLRNLSEEALDEIEPGGAGRREVQIESALHSLRLVGPVFVQHEVDVELPLRAPVDAVEDHGQ
jgi:hypothetical protein